MAKPAVLLLNLGSPDSTSVSDVRKYLKEFLLDERVIDAPAPIRNFVVRGLILPTRPKQSAAAYARVWTDEGSPLIVTSMQQRELLSEGRDFPVELAMRYGTPSIEAAITRLRKAGVTDLFILPLYPHYAMSSYETVLVRVTEEIAAQNWQVKTSILQPFYQDEDYISAMAEKARPYLEDDFDMLLFSYHGIPERHLRKSDPSHAHCLTVPDCCATCHPAHATCYRHQCFATTRALTAALGIPEEKTFVSFQSRLGRDPWLTPYTDKMLEEFPKKGIKRLRVLCPAFVADCLETLEEISMEGKEEFLKAGGEDFVQIPCLNDHPAFIKMLSGRVDKWLETVS